MIEAIRANLARLVPTVTKVSQALVEILERKAREAAMVQRATEANLVRRVIGDRKALKVTMVIEAIKENQLQAERANPARKDPAASRASKARMEKLVRLVIRARRDLKARKAVLASPEEAASPDPKESLGLQEIKETRVSRVQKVIEVPTTSLRSDPEEIRAKLVRQALAVIQETGVAKARKVPKARKELKAMTVVSVK